MNYCWSTKDNIATGKFSSAELSEQGKDGVELEIGLPGTKPCV